MTNKFELEGVANVIVKEYTIKASDGRMYMYKEYLDSSSKVIDHEIYSLDTYISQEGTEIENEIIDFIDNMQ